MLAHGLTKEGRRIPLLPGVFLDDSIAPYILSTTLPTFVADVDNNTYFCNAGRHYDACFEHTQTAPISVTDKDGLLRWSAHNVATWSNAFYKWATTGATSLNNLLIENGANSSHSMHSSASISSPGADIVVRITARDKGRTQLGFQIPGTDLSSTCIVDISDQSVVTLGTWDSATVEDVGSGWYEIVVCGSSSTISNKSVYMSLAAAGTTAYQGDGVSGMELSNCVVHKGGLNGMQRNPDTGDEHVHTLEDQVFMRGVHYQHIGGAFVVVEPSRINYLTDNWDNSSAKWVATNATTALSAVRNVSNNFMGTLTPSVGNLSHAVHSAQTMTFAIGSTYTASGYFKAAGYDFVSLVVANTHVGTSRAALFNLITGEVDTVMGDATASIEAVGNGIYRCSVTQTATVAGADSVYILAGEVGGDALPIFTGDGTSGVLFSDMQFEVGEFVTSLIPTRGALIVRPIVTVDIHSTVISLDAEQRGGTWVMSTQGVANLANGVLLDCDVAGSVFRMGATSADVEDDNKTTALAVTGLVPSISDGRAHKMAVAYHEIEGRSLAVDGNIPVSDGEDYLASNPPVTFHVLRSGTSSNMPGGGFNLITYTPNRETDGIIENITDPETNYPGA